MEETTDFPALLATVACFLWAMHTLFLFVLLYPLSDLEYLLEDMVALLDALF